MAIARSRPNPQNVSGREGGKTRLAERYINIAMAFNDCSDNTATVNICRERGKSKRLRGERICSCCRMRGRYVPLNDPPGMTY